MDVKLYPLPSFNISLLISYRMFLYPHKSDMNGL